MNETQINNDFVNNTNKLQKNQFDSSIRMDELAKIKNLHAWQVKNKELGPYVYSMIIITIACLFIPLGDSWQALVVRSIEIVVTTILIIYWIISYLKSTNKIDPYFNEKQLRLLGLDNISSRMVGLDQNNNISMVANNINIANQPINMNYPDIPRHNIINRKSTITSPSGKVKYDWKEFDVENAKAFAEHSYDQLNQNKHKQQNNFGFSNKQITNPTGSQFKYRIDKYCKSSIVLSPNGKNFADVVGDERNNKIHVINVQEDIERFKIEYYHDWIENIKNQSLFFLDNYFKKFKQASTKLLDSLNRYHYPDIKIKSLLLFENIATEKLTNEDIIKLRSHMPQSADLQHAITVYLSFLSIYSISISSLDNKFPLDFDKVKRMDDLRKSPRDLGSQIIDNDLVISLFLMEFGSGSASNRFMVEDLNDIKFDDQTQSKIGLVKEKSSSNKVKSIYYVCKCIIYNNYLFFLLIIL